MTLSVSAPRPEQAALVLDQYYIAFNDERRQLVVDAAVERQDIQARTVRLLSRRLAVADFELVAAGAPLLPAVPLGQSLGLPETTPDDIALLMYERNAMLVDRTSRQQDYGFQRTLAATAGDYTLLLQRRSAARVTPPPPSPLRSTLVILAVGLLAVVAVPFLMDRLDGTIRDPRTASATLRGRVLEVIPALPRRLYHRFAAPGSEWDRAFRSLAATAISTDRLPKSMMVSSPTGTMYEAVAADFAAGLASLGVSVALVGTTPSQSWYAPGDEPDAEPPPPDEPEPSPPGAIDELYPSDDTAGLGGASPAPPPPGGPGGPPTDGDEPAMPATGPTLPELLADAHAGRLPADMDTLLTPSHVDNLRVIPPGAEDAELDLNGLPPLLDALSRAAVDITILAGPALLEDADATIIAWSTRSVLWAVDVGHVNARDAQVAADRLELAGVETFGIVLVKRH
jgi:hypothetical protein